MKIRYTGPAYLDLTPDTVYDVVKLTRTGVEVLDDLNESNVIPRKDYLVEPTAIPRLCPDQAKACEEAPSGPFPENSAERKTYPIFSGVLNYFPSALAAVAHHSFTGNEKHNPGQPLQHARGKSSDHKDCAVRHLMESELPGKATEELTAAAWRVLAALQEHLETEGKPVAPAATF